jgi:hypothetical protein
MEDTAFTSRDRGAGLDKNRKAAARFAGPPTKRESRYRPIPMLPLAPNPNQFDTARATKCTELPFRAIHCP